MKVLSRAIERVVDRETAVLGVVSSRRCLLKRGGMVWWELGWHMYCHPVGFFSDIILNQACAVIVFSCRDRQFFEITIKIGYSHITTKNSARPAGVANESSTVVSYVH